jgi:hypothetical protein
LRSRTPPTSGNGRYSGVKGIEERRDKDENAALWEAGERGGGGSLSPLLIAGMFNGEGGLVAGWETVKEEAERREDINSAKSISREGWTPRPRIKVLLKQ